MRKLLLATTAIIGVLTAGPAMAMPQVMTVAALIGNGVGFGAAMTATFGAVGAALLQIGGSLLLNYAVSKLSTGSAGASNADTRLELTKPTSLPSYRYVYGFTWAPGTPVGWVVKGDILYICYLLNSRESYLPSGGTLLLDNRTVEVSGDPFDFTGAGAVATNDPFVDHCQYWIGRGDQTTCPDLIVSESDYFAATDAWRGRTVLWARLDCGDSGERSTRWPATPPAVNLEGQFSLVYDPRDGQTKFSRNQALIVLDALRTNPLRPYKDAYLWLDSFAEAADRAEDQITNKDGSKTNRYVCDGVLVWSDGSELEDQIDPLLAAGGARLIRVGGQLGIVPAVWRPSVHTLDDFTESQAISLTRWQASDDIYTECIATYTATDRAYESATAPTYVVDGAQAADGGIPKPLDLTLDFVTDHRQAQRLAKIAVMRSRMQRQISAEAFSGAFKLVAGSRCAVSLPAPYTPWNGQYEVESIQPGAGINDDDSITIRLPLSLRETSQDVYAWTAATEEQDVDGAVFSGSVARVQPPEGVDLTTGDDAALTSNGSSVARVQIDITASESASAQSYEWQYRVGSGSWQDGGSIDKDADLTAWIAPAQVGLTYYVRVRTVGLYGKSAWINSLSIHAVGPTETMEAPRFNSATSGSGQITLSMTQGDDGTKIQIWRASSDDISGAALLTTRNAGGNVTITHTDSGLGSGVTRYYWIRAADVYGNVSAFTASKSATTS